MALPTIGIDYFKEHSRNFSCSYKNDLLVSDHVEDIDRLRDPCRINAVTVFVCLGGELSCSVNLSNQKLTEDTILICFPGDIIQIHDTHNLFAYAMLISPALLEELSIDMTERSDFYLEVRENPVSSVPRDEIIALKPYYSLIKRSIENNRRDSAEIIRGLVQAFAFTIISLTRTFGNKGGKEYNQTRGKQLFNQFMSLVRRYHSSERSVKYYAGKMCLTSNYLSGAIKEYTGKTASEWVDEYVILEAKIMLKDTQITIQEISYRLNFPNQSTFGKYFKLHVGVGPKEYRRIEIVRR